MGFQAGAAVVVDSPLRCQAGIVSCILSPAWAWAGSLLATWEPTDSQQGCRDWTPATEQRMAMQSVFMHAAPEVGSVHPVSGSGSQALPSLNLGL